MRGFIPTLAALGLAAAAGVLSSSPAAAIEYPYCLQGRETGIPGDCNYRSYAECSASASGRDAFCNVNPRYAFAQRGSSRRNRGYGPGYNRGYSNGDPNVNNGPGYFQSY